MIEIIYNIAILMIFIKHSIKSLIKFLKFKIICSWKVIQQKLKFSYLLIIGED